uniref:Uncharacterized protein n=1 Tax=Graphocephala atropunctata TaxID=36148 RepID=A0A1B6L1V7_9HEMI
MDRICYILVAVILGISILNVKCCGPSQVTKTTTSKLTTLLSTTEMSRPKYTKEPCPKEEPKPVTEQPEPKTKDPCEPEETFEAVTPRVTEKPKPETTVDQTIRGELETPAPTTCLPPGSRCYQDEHCCKWNCLLYMYDHEERKLYGKCVTPSAELIPELIHGNLWPPQVASEGQLHGRKINK